MTKQMIWRVVRWMPTTLLVLAAGGLLIMFVRGGMARVAAWHLAQLLPAPALLILLGAGLYALVRRWSRALAVTLGLSLLALTPALLLIFPVAYPASLADSAPAVTVRLPADGPLKVGWGGDTREVNYHVIAPDQRWAYDLLMEPYLTGSPELTDYGCYGIPVVAPAAGEVVAAHDGEPDMTPGQSSNNFTAPLGNYVALRLETGTYLILAHLRPGSVVVDVGDQVAEGDPLGKCGNSGNTSEPHIHIHHQRQDPTVFPVNFAEGLPLYFRDHDGPPMPVGGLQVVNGTPVATGATVQHVGR